MESKKKIVMPWKLIPDLSSEEITKVAKKYSKKAHFLIYENIDGLTKEIIQNLGETL